MTMTVPLTPNGDGTWSSPDPAWDHLIKRESSGIPDIIQQITDVNSGGNEAEGLFQITPRTWDAHGGREFAQSARFARPQQQAIVAARIFQANPSGGDWGAGRPGREGAAQLAAGLVPLESQPVEEPPVADSKKPAFNEFPLWTGASQSRNGAVPDLALIHTQEPGPTVNHGPPPDNAAELLAAFCRNLDHSASYHNYVSQASDGGVTVVNGVDTDLASWSVGDANNYTLNYCFAYSFAGWTTEEWMRYAGNAIDVMAYLIVQDAVKYKFEPKFLGTGGVYNTSDPHASGVADHRFVTDVVGWGDHQDVGPNFPREYFRDRLAYWAAGGESQAPPPVEPPAADPRKAEAEDFKRWVSAAPDRALLEYLALQIGTGDPAWPSAGRTVRDQVFYGNETPT